MYVENLHKIVESYWSAVNSFQEHLRVSKEKYSAEYLRKETAENAELMEKMRINKANDIRQEYNDYLSRLKRKVETISGGNINNDDIGLLSNPYIKLNQTELDALVNKHKDNYTMLKVLKAYVSAQPTLSLGEINKSSLTLPDYIITPEEKETLAQQVCADYLSFLSNGMSFAISEKMYYENNRLKLSE